MKVIFTPIIAVILFFSFNSFAVELMTFDHFLKTVSEQNLDLKIESAKMEAAKSEAKSLNIPPPMVGYMRMTDQSGSSADGFEVSQMIPFPSKISAGRSSRKFEAEAQKEVLEGMQSEILAKARLVYFSLWASQARLDAFKEKKKAIESHLRLARAGVRSDSFLRIHLLKAESDLDLLGNDILSAEQELREKEVLTAKFANIDPVNFHPKVEDPGSISPLSERTLSSPPQLESVKLSLESFKALEREERSSWFPDLYLRYQEIGETRLMPKISEVTIGVSLPFLFPWDVSASSGKATAERMQAEYRLEQEKRRIESEKEILMERAVSLKKQLDNLNHKLLPKAEKRMKLVHNLAPRDMESLQDHREAMEAFPDLKLKVLDVRFRYEEAVAELLKFSRSQIK